MQLTVGDKLFHLSVLGYLVLGSLGVLLIPFRTLEKWARTDQQPAALDWSAEQQAKMIGAVVEKVASHCFWRPSCLQQSVAVILMLRRRHIPSHLHLGVRQGENGLEAHAWVNVGEIAIIGGEIRPKYVDLL